MGVSVRLCPLLVHSADDAGNVTKNEIALLFVCTPTEKHAD